MDNIIPFKQVATPANGKFLTPEIARYEITQSFGSETSMYVRTASSQCFDVETFQELWDQFCSDEGYRITFPIGEGLQMTVWKAKSEAELSAEAKAKADFIQDVKNGKYGVVTKRYDKADGSVVFVLDDGGVISHG